MVFTAQLPHVTPVCSAAPSRRRVSSTACSTACSPPPSATLRASPLRTQLAPHSHLAGAFTPRSSSLRRRRASGGVHQPPKAEAAAPVDDEGVTVGRPNALWRVLAVLPYLVPLMGSLAFGQDMYDTFPLISWLINVFGPMLQAYYSNSFTPFFVFFALYLAVVRNEKLPHFMRFNAMQSILLDICIMLGGLIIQYMPFEIAFSTIGGLCNNLVFTTGAASVFYCVFYTLQGKYADIPTVSEAVYIQVR